MSDTQRKLNNGDIAQGVVILSQTGEISDPLPMLQQDLIGNLKTPYPDRTRGFVFGKNTNVNNTPVDLWQGPTARYVFPLVPQQMALVSSSANDTAAGSGVQYVMIHYLDDQYAEKTEIVAMSGLTPSLTVATNILRINGLHTTKIGTVNGAAAGNISLTNTAGTITYGYIATASNTSRNGIYTVPRGYTGYINHWQMSCGSPTGQHFTQITLQATCHDAKLYPGIFLVQDEQGTLNGGNIIDLPTPIPIPETSDIKLSAVSDAGGAAVIAIGSIMGWFEKN